MKRQSLAAAVAVAPLLAAMAAGAAQAATSITGASGPVSTSKAGDVDITSSGTVTPTSTEAGVTLDSNATVTNKGVISAKDVDHAVGVLVKGGTTGSVTNSGAITINETVTTADVNSNTIEDQPWAKGTGRYGILVTGPGTFTGDITNAAGGTITIVGNDSAGISIGTGITGSVNQLGVLKITGDKSVGIEITDGGSVSGDMILGNTVSASGAGASAVVLGGDVGGKVQISGVMSATGYRSADRSVFTADGLQKLVAAELQQGGPAVSIAGDVGTGVLITAAAPTGTKADDKTTDADKDGIVDSAQTAGAVSSFGGAPALQVGSADPGTAITIGLPTSGDFAFGLINNGTITGSGVFDTTSSPNLPAPVPGTAVLIGLDGGGAVTIEGGLRNTGVIQAGAVNANSTAIHLSSGATVPTIANTGTISSVSTTTGKNQANAIEIDAGASVTSVANTGTILANLRGSVGGAGAIIDNGGALKTVTNTGTITATVTQTDTKVAVSGEGIAIDASHGSGPVTITQTQSTVTGAAAPAITGHILLGSGADTIDVEAGTLTGTMVFGDGADTLVVNGGATVTGGVFDSDGALTVNVHKGTLSVGNTATAAAPMKVTGVNVDASGVLQIAADPQANTTGLPADNVNTHFFTSGSSTFQDGATLGLTLQSLQTETSTTYTILTADTAHGATLSTGKFSQGALEGAPFLYTVVASADAANIYLTVQRKTPAQLGFSAAQAAAYDAVFNALLADKDIQSAFLTQTTQGGLFGVYDQMLPDQGQGVFEALDVAAQSIANLTAAQPDAGTRVAGSSLWIQEVNERVRRDTGATPGSATRLFGLAGGYEHMGAGGGALGVSLAYLNVQENDSAAAVGEHVVASVVEGGVYYRRAIGGLRLSARGAGGYAWFSGDRWFVAPGVQRHAESGWNGAYANAHAGVGYEARFGRFYARPELSLDYLYLRENARTESGGGAGFDLTVDARSSNRLSGEAVMVIGGQWGRETWLRPELRAGYRHIFSGQVGDTVASFTSGSPFILATTNDTGGWATFGFSLKAGTALSYMALEGDADIRDGEQRYDLRLAGRSIF